MKSNYERSQEAGGSSLSAATYTTMPDLVHELIMAIVATETGEGA
jgi:hypothetical protein